LGLVRILCKTPRHKPLKLTQAKKDDIKDYHSEANKFRFECIPFSKVKAIQYTSVYPMTLKYKLSFEGDWTSTKIQSMLSRRRQPAALKMPPNSRENQILSAEKLKDLESMLILMPALDREFMQTVINNGKPKSVDIHGKNAERATASAGALLTQNVASDDENISRRKRAKNTAVRKEVNEVHLRSKAVTSKNSPSSSGQVRRNIRSPMPNHAKPGPVVRSKRATRSRRK